MEALPHSGSCYPTMKNKLYTDETYMNFNTQIQYYINQQHVGSIIPLES